MNSYKLNGIAGHLTRTVIVEGLGITPTEIYRVVKEVDIDKNIILHDGRKFKLVLKEINGKE